MLHETYPLWKEIKYEHVAVLNWSHSFCSPMHKTLSHWIIPPSETEIVTRLTLSTKFSTTGFPKSACLFSASITLCYCFPWACGKKSNPPSLAIKSSSHFGLPDHGCFFSCPRHMRTAGLDVALPTDCMAWCGEVALTARLKLRSLQPSQPYCMHACPNTCVKVSPGFVWAHCKKVLKGSESSLQLIKWTLANGSSLTRGRTS